MRPINRVDPVGPVHAYKTYSVSSPLATHWRPATCAEVGCEPHINGWVTRLPVDSDGSRFLRRVCDGDIDGVKRAFREAVEDGWVVYTFPAGQACFKAAQHRVPVGRPELYAVRGGDWRGTTGLIRQHTRAVDWVEDFALNQQRIADEQARG